MLPIMNLHPSIQSLVEEIDAFRERDGLNPTAFGLRAVNDGKFLSDLRAGRVPSIVTIDRVRAFMVPRVVADAERVA